MKGLDLGLDGKDFGFGFGDLVLFGEVVED
jgi:hypothetical protein